MSWLDFNTAATNDPGPPKEAKKIDRDEVKRSLLAQLESVLGYLFPAGFADPKGSKFYIGDISGQAGESLSVELKGERAGLWHDFATGDGGDVFDLWRAARGCVSFIETIRDASEYTGATSNTPRRSPKRKSPKGGEAWGIPTETYHYVDTRGSIIAEVERYEWEEGGKRKKTFRPWDAIQRQYKAPETRPLYNLPGVARAPEIIIVEGEKAADALIYQEICATTAMGGSNAPIEKTDWTPLRGRKVVIWPDNDAAGHDYAERLAEHLETQGVISASILHVPATRPEKWDAADAKDEDLGAIIRSMRAPPATGGAHFELDFWDHENLASIPRVEFVYNRFYAKGYTSVTAAPPKVGKSLLGLIEAVDIATGRGLLTGEVQAPQRVYYYNAEDDLNTIKNRVGAILKHYKIPQEEIRGQLAISSGIANEGFYVISGADGKIHEAQFEVMEAKCTENKIDAVILDPLQDLSRSPETNEVMRLLGGRLRKFASKCDLAVGLIHHTRKMQPGVKASIDDMRGGSALRGTARFNRLLVPMTEDDAAKAGLGDHRNHFQVGDIEMNLAPPSSDYARWYEKVSVICDNGESVGVIAPWKWPEAFDGISPSHAIAAREAIMRANGEARESEQSNDWAGHIIGEILGIDSRDKAGKAKIKTILKTWIASGVLAVERRYQASKGREFPFIVPGPNDMREGLN